MGFPHTAAADAFDAGGWFFLEPLCPGAIASDKPPGVAVWSIDAARKCILAPPLPHRRIPMPRHANTNAWLLAGWLAVTLMGVGAAPAQSPDAIAAARELMVTLKSGDQFKAFMPSIMNT